MLINIDTLEEIQSTKNGLVEGENNTQSELLNRFNMYVVNAVINGFEELPRAKLSATQKRALMLVHFCRATDLNSYDLMYCSNSTNLSKSAFNFITRCGIIVKIGINVQKELFSLKEINISHDIISREIFLSRLDEQKDLITLLDDKLFELNRVIPDVFKKY